MIARRGDGIGLEVTATTVRGVRLSHDDPGRVAAVCEVPIGRFDDDATVFDALVRARGQLGADSVPTRVAWFPAGATMQRRDATGLTGPELNQLRHRLADDSRITSTMLVDVDARRWMLAVRWDHAQAWWLQDLVERAGFSDVTIEPAPVALGRSLRAEATLVRRAAGQDRPWVAVLDDRVPVAAIAVEPGALDVASIASSSDDLGDSDLGEIRDEASLSLEVARIAARLLADVDGTDELDVQLVVLDEPYPPFPAHDVRAPQRIGVALGAAVGAAGLAGRLREVDVLHSVRPTADARTRPWAIERLADTPLEVERARPSWWRRTDKLVRSRFRRRPA